MQPLRQVPFFDLYPINCQHNVKASTDTETDVAHNPCNHPLIDYLRTSKQPIYLTAVSGGGCIWLGTQYGKLIRLRITTDAKAFFVNTDSSLTRSCSLQGSSCHDGSNQELHTTGRRDDKSSLVVSHSKEFPLFHSRLTHLFVSTDVALDKDDAEDDTDPFNSCKPHDPPLDTLQKHVLCAVGRQSENEWICKVFLFTGQGQFVSKISETQRTSVSASQSVDDTFGITENPKPIREIVLMDSQTRSREGTRASEVTIVSSDLNRTATKFVVGFSNGCIVYYLVDLRNLKIPVRGRRIQLGEEYDQRVTPGTKAQAKHHTASLIPCDDIITNLFFGYSKHHNEEVLFITTTSTISCILVGDDLRSGVIILFSDTIGGCEPRCATPLKSLENNIYDRLCVWRNECMFIYGADQGNLSAFPFCSAQLCRGFKSYAIVVHKENLNDVKDSEVSSVELWGDSNSSCILSQIQRQIAPREYVTIIINNPTLRFLCYSSQVEGVVDIIPFNTTSAVMITASPHLQLYELREKSIFSRIENLVERRLFDWSVDIALSEGAPEEYIMNLHVSHGHWLFEKKSYNDAAQAYSKTIQYLEPSGIISKFLEKQQLSSLILYLKALYAHGTVTKNHLALLFSCFCICGEEEGFLKFLEESNSSTHKNVDWSPAVVECRLYGNIQLAKKIAQHGGLTTALLSILIEDFNDVDEALTLLLSRPLQEVASILFQPSIGGTLLYSRCQETIQLIQTLFDKKQIDISLFIPLFTRVNVLCQDKQSIGDSHSTTEPLHYDTEESYDNDSSQFNIDEEEHKDSNVCLYTSLKLDSEFLHFVFRALRRVLEDVETAPRVEFSSLIVALELLLRYQNQNGICSLKANELGIKEDVLQAPIEPLICDHFKSFGALLSAFCLTRLYGRSRGLLIECERIASLCGSLRSHEAIPLWCHGALEAPLLLNVEDPHQFLNYCARYGVKDSHFWSLALKQCRDISHTGLVEQLLKKLACQLNQANFRDYISPVTVIRLLYPQFQDIASSAKPQPICAESLKESGVSFGEVKSYLIDQALTVKERTELLRVKTDVEIHEFEKSRTRLQEMKRNLYCFSLEGQSCWQCNAPLELPVTQFMCGHAYHRLCIKPDKNRVGCPLCTPDHELKLNFVKENLESLRHEGYDDLLKKGTVPVINYVATLLGHGLLSGQISTTMASSVYSTIRASCVKKNKPWITVREELYLLKLVIPGDWAPNICEMQSSGLEDGVEIETLCVKCLSNGVTRFLLTPIPRFRDVIVSSFECSHCGHTNREVQSGLSLNEAGGSRHELTVTCEHDLNRQVLKGIHAIIELPDIQFEIPAITQQGICTTVEGVLTESIEGLKRILEYQDDLRQTEIQHTIKALEEYLLGTRFPFTFILEDPAGQSFIEPLISGVSQQDPQLRLTYFKRTLDQLHEMGYYETQNEDDQGLLQKSPKSTQAWNATATIDMGSLPNQLKLAGWDLSKSVEENVGPPQLRKKSDEPMKQDSLQTDNDDPSITFSITCPHCGQGGSNEMCEIDIPGFRKCMIMAFNCSSCGSRSNEVKPMGAYGEKGRKWTLHVTSVDDLNRDILKSDTAEIRIPDTELEMAMGTLGGVFTTIEGLLTKVIDHLSQNSSIFVGDSTCPARKNAFNNVIDNLKKYSTDPEHHPFVLVLDDAADLSMISKRYTSHELCAHGIDDDTQVNVSVGQLDPYLMVESYERSMEQNNELGLSDMVVDNY